MKYKHKPTEIEAEKWGPVDMSKLSDEAKADRERILKVVQHSPEGDYVPVGGHPIYLNPGDAVTGDGNVIKAAEFEKNYEASK